MYLMMARRSLRWSGTIFFTSSHGCVTIISMENGKMLDVEPLSKVSKACKPEACIISTLVPKQLLKSPKPLVINPGAFCVAGVREADRSLVTKSNYKAKEKNKVHIKVHRKVIIERLSYVLFLEVCMFSTSIDFPSNLTIYFDDHYYSCYHVPKIKRVLFHYIEGCGSVTMETAHMKFVFLVSASDVLSYAT
jgi:hypothetical protein